MKLRYLYDSFLRATVQEVTVFDATLKREADEMLKIMKQFNGIGLSGNQVGLDKRMIVCGYEPLDKKDDFPRIPETVLINPKIVKYSKDKIVFTEGCLSFPGLELPVERPAKIVVEAQDLNGKKITIKAGGLLSRIIQHETDHLDGIIFSDRTNAYKDIANARFARIVFLGSDDFSATIFDALLEAKLGTIAIITETAKPAGRGRELQEPVMANLAKRNNLAVFQPETKVELTEIVKQLQPDLLILASYGRILPEETLNIPAYGSLNIHPSLLPKYRGATPIQSAILGGERETGVTLMVMNPVVDEGEIVAQEKNAIASNETTTSLKEKAARTGAGLLIKNLPIYLSGQSRLEKQTSSEVSATKKLTKEMGEIDWQNSAEVIDRQIRALNPWPGTFTWLGNQRLKILEVILHGDRLELVTVQLEGKKPADWKDFVRGHEQELTKTDWYGKITK
ncbi:MAG TPA: methionyl-tRNA formyltransferase [Candidatus Saccharimonadales bacterium]|nr:methionyl-tRNA formyltransferase [Candidatus Saccharimonadales bacterium]